MATLLQNIQSVCVELGLPSPSAVASNSDETVTQLLALMNRIGDSMSTENDWQFLSREYRFQTVFKSYTGTVTSGSQTISALSSVVGLSTDFMVTGTGISQDTFVTAVGTTTATINIPADNSAVGATLTFGQAEYDMPADYDRIVNKTQYNKSDNWALLGPKDPQEWQWLKASYAATGPRIRWRIQGNQFVIWPAPSAVETMGFEYQSGYWAKDSTGVAKAKLTADSDTSYFPDRLLILGTKLKYWEIKGFDTTNLSADFSRELLKFKGANAGADTLSLAPRYPDLLLSQANLPDTGYGVTN
jgi:hypothetical protein